MTFRDPKGNPLKAVLLQVVDRDADGPITLKVRLDKETIGLAAELQSPLVPTPTFLLVWTPIDSRLGEVAAPFGAIFEELEQLKTLAAQRDHERRELDASIAEYHREAAALQAENKEKTKALRQLQKERDPERFEAAVAAAVATCTADLEAKAFAAMTLVGELRREADELRASKRRLKEANERLKNERK